MTEPLPLFSAQLQDEAPAIGSGFRFVFVKRGRKWVYLLCPFTMRAARLKRALWDVLAPVEITDPTALTRTRRALQAGRTRAQRDPTRLERQAMGDET